MLPRLEILDSEASLLTDLRIAVRTLGSWRFGAAVAVATLAIGIGAATVLSAMLRSVLAASTTAIEDPEQLGRIYLANRAAGVERGPVPLEAVMSVLAEAGSLEAVGAWISNDARVSGYEQAVAVTSVTPRYFEVLRARPSRGRLFVPEDFDGALVAIVSSAVWSRRFAGQELSDAPTLIVDGGPRTIVGVLPDDAYRFSFIGIGGDIWVPLAEVGSRRRANVSVIGRIAPNSDWATAASEISALPVGGPERQGWTWHVIPVTHDSRFRLLAGTTATLLPGLIVLTIACVNVACMLLARGFKRETEFAIRAALGASRALIVRQLLLESALLGVLGGAGGAVVAVFLLKLVTSSTFVSSKPELAGALSGVPLLPAAFAFSVAACVLFGAAPALRLSGRDLSATLKGSSASQRIRFVGYGAKDVVVFAETGIAIVLVVISAMWFSFFSALRTIPVSFAADDLAVVSVPVGQLREVSDRVSALPGVTAVTIASAPPGSYRTGAASVRADAGSMRIVDVTYVDESFFRTIGLQVREGRPFTASERVGSAAVGVISESAARALWGKGRAIGGRVEVNSATGSNHVSIIGVCADALGLSALGLRTGEIYLPLDIATLQRAVLIARTPGAANLIRPIAEAARPSPAHPIPDVTIAGDGILRGAREGAGAIRVFAGFAVIALLLAATGVFGVVSQSVCQRTGEFGVRMALGASRPQILRMILWREMKLILAALAAATIAVFAITRGVFEELVVVSARRPEWTAGLIGLSGLVALTAVLVASYRVLRLNPADILRRI